MRRKLVNFEVFDRIEKDSLSQTERELTEAADVLGDVLETGPLHFRFFDKGKVVYDTSNGNHIHTNFTIKNESVTFDDITELVVDTESQRKKLRECVSKMVEAVIDGNNHEADMQFNNYVKHYFQAKKSNSINESVKKFKKKKFPFDKKDKKKATNSKFKLFKFGNRSEKKVIKEWKNLCENVNQYVDFTLHGHNSNNSEVKKNNIGDVTSVKIPTAHVRNEGKILTMQYKTMKTDVKVLRENAKTLANHDAFIKGVSKIKRLNNFSQPSELEESINALVSSFPNVLYLTQNELAKTIGQALDNASQVNFDDNTCQFMAEGILRVAHDNYKEKVSRIGQLANAKLEDTYEQFQSVVNGFYPRLDESMESELQIYTDLYNSLVEVHRLASASGNNALREESVSYLNELKDVLEGINIPTLELAVDASEFLQTIVEANLEGASETWHVSNDTHETENGDHPALSRLAKVGGNPGSYGNDYGDPAPVSDGKSYGKKDAEEMRSRGFGNKAPAGTYPELTNPFSKSTTASEYKMKGEKYDDGLTFSTGSKDEFPELTNPYLIRPFVTPKVKE